MAMMEKLLEKSMCNAMRRKWYVEKNTTCYHVMMMMMMMVIIVRVKLRASKEYLPGKLLLVFDH